MLQTTHARARVSVPGLGGGANGLLYSAAHALAAGEVEIGRRLLSAMSDCATAAWLSSERRGPVEYTFDGQAYMGEAGPMHWSGTPLLWIQGTLMAIALRRKHAIEAAARYPIAFCRRAGSSTRDEYVPLFAEALQAHLVDAPDVTARLAEAIACAHPSRATIAPPLYAYHDRGLMEMVESTVRRDQVSFTRAALHALDAHRARVTRGEESEYVDGLFDFELAGAGALGVSSGLVWEIETPYVPAWLVEGSAS